MGSSASRRRRARFRLSKRGEAYTPSGVVAMAVIVPLSFATAAFIGWVVFQTFVVDGMGLFDTLHGARAPVPAIWLLVGAALGFPVLCRIGWQGAGWLFRVAKGEVPRATPEQARGRGRAKS